MPMTSPANAKVQTLRCYEKVAISASVSIGNHKTPIYLERIKPNMGKLKAVIIEARNPTTAIHLGV